LTVPRKNILWADDEKEFLEPHKIFLEKRDYKVTTVNSGEDAIELLKTDPFDLLLIDEMMTGMDGLTAIKTIRELNIDIPIIMITKNEEEWLMEEAIAGDIENFLTKPVNPSQILSACKSILESRKLQSDFTSKEYISEFQKINASIDYLENMDEWFDVYDKLVNWSLRFDRHDESGLRQIFDDQFADINDAFTSYLIRNYTNWLKNEESKHLTSGIFPSYIQQELENDKKVCLVVVDCMRLDHLKVMLPLLSEHFSIKHNFALSLLPSATPYSRNAIFSGLFPRDIQKKFPREWEKMKASETSMNQYEHIFLREQLNRNNLKNKSMKYAKAVTLKDGQTLEKHFNEYKNIDLIAIVVNYVDILGHAKAESNVINELLHDESAYRDAVLSWFENSWLITILKILAHWRHKVIITSDHGSIRVDKPVLVKGDRRTSSGIRYKHGKNLNVPDRTSLTIKDPALYGLPADSVFNQYILANGKHFYVYPNNYNKYVNKLKSSFQHGGISMEEVIVPVTVLEGKV